MTTQPIAQHTVTYCSYWRHNQSTQCFDCLKVERHLCPAVPSRLNMAPLPAAQAGKLGLGQHMKQSFALPLVQQPVRSCVPCAQHRHAVQAPSASCSSSQPSSSSSRHVPGSIRTRRGVIAQAVAAAPETLLEKGGPGAKYGDGAVVKVRGRDKAGRWWSAPASAAMMSNVVVGP